MRAATPSTHEGSFVKRTLCRTIRLRVPRPIWVLYPQNGQPVLCQGVVWLYHEFRESMDIGYEEWWRVSGPKNRPCSQPDLAESYRIDRDF